MLAKEAIPLKRDPRRTMFCAARPNVQGAVSGKQKPEPGVPCNITGEAGLLGVGFTIQRERFVV